MSSSSSSSPNGTALLPGVLVSSTLSWESFSAGSSSEGLAVVNLNEFSEESEEEGNLNPSNGLEDFVASETAKGLSPDASDDAKGLLPEVEEERNGFALLSEEAKGLSFWADMMNSDFFELNSYFSSSYFQTLHPSKIQ